MSARNNFEIRSHIKTSGELELSLVELPMPVPDSDEIVVRVDAAPLNPSDIGLLIGPADLESAVAGGTPERPVTTLSIDAQFLPTVKARLGQAMSVGNEGAGTVVDAGSGQAAQELLGRVVGIVGGSMYAQYRKVKAESALRVPDETTAEEAADWFVGPITALGMTDTMRSEGFTGLVHTAAASAIGQMLVKICLADEVPLVNIVRRPAQADILYSLGAQCVCDSSKSTFHEDLVGALGITGVDLGFDAVGGGPLAGDILKAMEVAASLRTEGYQRYGTSARKHVYIYGGLEKGPTVLNLPFGAVWGLGGWLVTEYLKKITPDRIRQHRDRIATELKTTFVTQYAGTFSLTEALHPENIRKYVKHATGEKYLINPSA